MTQLPAGRYPLKSLDAISVLVETNTMWFGRLTRDLRNRPAAEREIIDGYLGRSIEIQHLYLARMLALRTTVEFLMECRPERTAEGWVGVDRTGVQLEPPEDVQYILGEIQQNSDKHGRGVAP